CFRVALEAHRVGLDGLAKEIGHERHNRAGVNAAAQERPKRDITHKVEPDRFPKQSVELLGTPLLAEMETAMVGKRQVPVAPDFYAIFVASQTATGGQRVNPVKHGLGRGHILERKKVAQTFYI